MMGPVCLPGGPVDGGFDLSQLNMVLPNAVLLPLTVAGGGAAVHRSGIDAPNSIFIAWSVRRS